MGTIAIYFTLRARMVLGLKPNTLHMLASVPSLSRTLALHWISLGHTMCLVWSLMLHMCHFISYDRFPKVGIRISNILKLLDFLKHTLGSKYPRFWDSDEEISRPVLFSALLQVWIRNHLGDTRWHVELHWAGNGYVTVQTMKDWSTQCWGASEFLSFQLDLPTYMKTFKLQL